jgi:hypothetical protein
MISFIIDGTANAEAVDVYDLTETSVDYMYSIDYDDIGDEYQLELRMDTASLKLARKLEENSRELGEISESTTGYQLYHNTIHDPDEIDGEVYHSERQENENYIPEIRGSSIHRYFVDPEPDGYVDETAEFYRLPPEQFLGGPRILIREITSKEGIVSSYIEQELFYPKSVFGMRSDTLPETVLTALLNSNVLYFYFLVDGQKSTQDLFPRISKSDLTSLPISKEVDGPIFSDEKSGSVSYLDKLNSLAATEQDARRSRFKLNLSLMDYLGNYSEGPKLTDVGFYQPTDGSILNATADEYNNHQIQNVRTVRDDYSITIEVTARYKPEDQDKFETDGYGYTETDYFEAFTLTDLTDKEAALIEAFVPVAVEDEIGGFSDNATKTISLIDRLKDITLPDIDDVQDDLQRYIKTKQRAEELDEKIEKTDQLIDEMVYDLYDLTEEEIEIVEEAVNDD